MAVRIALAVTVAYELADRLPRNDLLQGSPFATVGASLERIVGTCVGVALATLYIDHVPLNALALAAGRFVALLIAMHMPIGLTGQMQVANGTLFVLVLGGPGSSSGYWRIGDVIIGGAVGILAVLIFPPATRLAPAESAIDTLQRAQVAQLRRIGDEIVSFRGLLSESSGTPSMALPSPLASRTWRRAPPSRRRNSRCASVRAGALGQTVSSSWVSAWRGSKG